MEPTEPSFLSTMLVLTARPADLPTPLAIGVCAFAFLFGSAWGSFLNVVISRVPEGLSVVTPRSRCPKCKTQIASYDNIPVLSWLLLRGKCRHCGASISWRYPFIEALMGLACLTLTAQHGFGLATLEAYTMIAILVAIAFVDIDTWSVPHPLWIALVVAGLGFGGAHAALDGDTTVLVDRVIGAVGAGAMLGAVVVVATWVLRRVGRIDGETTAMGWGDPLILVGVGAFLGWRMLPLVLFFASVQGSVVAIALKAAGGLKGEAPVSDTDDWVPPAGAVPFGPFLALGALEAAFFGDRFYAWLLPMMGFGLE